MRTYVMVDVLLVDEFGDVRTNCRAKAYIWTQ